MSVSGQNQLANASPTCRAVGPRTLLVKNSSQNLNGIGVLQNVEQRCVHRQMLDCFEHMDEILWFKELACTQ
jgi:hypothetical protein